MQPPAPLPPPRPATLSATTAGATRASWTSSAGRSARASSAGDQKQGDEGAGIRARPPFRCLSRRDVDKGAQGAVARPDPKATLWGLPSPAFVAYLGLAALCVGGWAYAAVGATPVSLPAAAALALLPGFGPVAAAFLVPGAQGGSGPEPWLSRAVHAALGVLFCAVPIAWAAFLVLRPPPAGGLHSL